MDKNAKIYVAGHRGLVGSALMRQLQAQGYHNIVMRTHAALDLTNQQAVADFFKTEKPEYVFLAAAKVGGIHANNTYPADYIYQNLIIEANVIHAAHINNVQKLLFLGSSCIYPKFAEQPMKEEMLLTGLLESTNEPYAIAKIAGIKLCESYNRQFGRDYRSVMPTNLYGENDNFHPQNSHVIPALIRRLHEAKLSNSPQVKAWGSGEQMREFLHVDDMAEASIFVINIDSNQYQKKISPMISHINVGTGVDCTIRELVETVAKVVGYQGEIVFDTTKPDGTPRKLMDISKLNEFGWRSKISLEQGLRKTYDWFIENQGEYRL